MTTRRWFTAKSYEDGGKAKDVDRVKQMVKTNSLDGFKKSVRALYEYEFEKGTWGSGNGVRACFLRAREDGIPPPDHESNGPGVRCGPISIRRRSRCGPSADGGKPQELCRIHIELSLDRSRSGVLNYGISSHVRFPPIVRHAQIDATLTALGGRDAMCRHFDIHSPAPAGAWLSVQAIGAAITGRLRCSFESIRPALNDQRLS